MKQKTLYYYTSNMLAKKRACSYARARFRQIFKVKANEKVFLTPENVKKVIGEDIDLDWIITRDKAGVRSNYSKSTQTERFFLWLLRYEMNPSQADVTRAYNLLYKAAERCSPLR